MWELFFLFILQKDKSMLVEARDFKCKNYSDLGYVKRIYKSKTKEVKVILKERARRRTIQSISLL